jgi:hypothetical protein
MYIDMYLVYYPTWPHLLRSRNPGTAGLVGGCTFVSLDSLFPIFQCMREYIDNIRILVKSYRRGSLATPFEQSQRPASANTQP